MRGSLHFLSYRKSGWFFRLINAASYLLVNLGYYLFRFTLFTRLRHDANDRLRVRTSHQKPTVSESDFHAVARVEGKLAVLLPQHFQNRRYLRRRTDHLFFNDTVARK